MENADFTLVYILGSGHCGSTLLNLLLNGHSRMLGLSEIQNIHRLASTLHQDEPTPLAAPFWRSVIDCYEVSTNQTFEDIFIGAPGAKEVLSYTIEESQEWAQANEELLTCIARQSEAKLLVDASKFFSRCYLLQRSGMFNLRIIHLIRDGRAIVNSYARKYDQFRIGFRRWLIPSLGALYLRPQVKSSCWLGVKYEALADQPIKSLRRICGFLEIPFEPEMIHYRRHPYFGIFGNRMAKRNDERIYLDNAWKQELSLNYRLRFALLGGWLNALYGYGPF